MMSSCALSNDPHYPADLENLGYFIDDIDEIRWIDHPTRYFEYFITKNERHNIAHREAFNTAVRSIIYDRLEQIGMTKYLCSDNNVEWESPDLKKRNSHPDTAIPHIPVYASKNVGTSPRVVVLFGESSQDLGVIAPGIIAAEGGVNAGSVISFIQHINATEIDSTRGFPLSNRQPTKTEVKMANPKKIDLVDGDTESPAIILANTGQLRWCRSLGRAMTYTSWNALTCPSAVDECAHYDTIRNSVPAHCDVRQHVDQILTTVVPKLCGKDAKIEIIAIADSCEYVSACLDRNWSSIAPRILSLALINPDFSQPGSYTNVFFENFLLQRTRGFVKDSNVPANTAMFGPSGGLHSWEKGFSYDIYSIPGESNDELIFPRHFHNVLEWQAKVASDFNPCEEKLTIRTFADDNVGELSFDICTRVNSVAEIGAEIKSGHKQRFHSADLLNMPPRIETTRKKDELARGVSLVECRKDEDQNINMEDEKGTKEFGEIDAPKKVVPINTKTKAPADAQNSNVVADVKMAATEVGIEAFENEAFKNKAKAQHKKNEADSTPDISRGNTSGIISHPSQTQVEVCRGNWVGEVPNEGAGRPLTIDDAIEIGTKRGVEQATRGLIKDMKILNKIAHIALPGQAEPQSILKIVKAAVRNDILNDKREAAPCLPKFEKHVSFKDPAPENTEESEVRFGIRNFSGANVDVVPHHIMDRVIVATKHCNSFATTAQKELAPQDGECYERPSERAVVELAVSPGGSSFATSTYQKSELKSTSDAKLFNKEAKKKAAHLDFGGDRATDEEAYLACPPERMERLPSVVAATLHQGNPEVKLSKYEKAAILQTTVLSSPVKEREEGGSL